MYLLHVPVLLTERPLPAVWPGLAWSEYKHECIYIHTYTHRVLFPFKEHFSFRQQESKSNMSDKQDDIRSLLRQPRLTCCHFQIHKGSCAFTMLALEFVNFVDDISGWSHTSI
jgi:hypothetical protein